MSDTRPHLSASQVDTFILCTRKWAWNKVGGIKADPHPSAELGTEVHRILAEWLSNGTAIDLDATYETADGVSHYPGRIAAAGLKHLPAPSKELEVEGEIFLKTEFADFLGFVDLAEILDDGTHEVTDHKSTSNFKWAKAEDDLRTDVQALIYAAHRLIKYNLDEVRLKWVYYRTRGKPASKKIRLKLLRTDVERGFERIEEASTEMLAIHRDGLQPLDLEPNPHACDMYGGCFYREHCNLTPIQRIKAIMAKQTLAEKMAARKAAAAEAGEGETEETGTPAVNPPGEAVEAAGAKPPKPDASDAEKALAAATEAVKAEKKAAAKKAKADKAAAAKAAKEAKTGTPAATPAPKSANGAGKGFTLYINCHPVKGLVPVVNARELVQPIADAIAGDHKVADYRMIDFAKGPAYLCDALRERLTINPISGVSITVDARTDEGRHVVGVLEDFAGTVVRGF